MHLTLPATPTDRPGAVAGLALVDGGFSGVAEWAGGDREEVRRRLRPPRFAVPLSTWLGEAGRWLPPGVDPREPWVAGFLRTGVEVDGAGIARARFLFDNYMQMIDALYEQRPSRLMAGLTCPVLLCPAGGGQAAAKRPAIERARAAAKRPRDLVRGGHARHPVAISGRARRRAGRLRHGGGLPWVSSAGSE